MPTVDRDEYFRVTGPSELFGTPSVPKNYFHTVWDAIVRHEGWRVVWFLVENKENPAAAGVLGGLARGAHSAIVRFRIMNIDLILIWGSIWFDRLKLTDRLKLAPCYLVATCGNLAYRPGCLK